MITQTPQTPASFLVDINMAMANENIDLDELAESHGVSLSPGEQTDGYGYQTRVIASSKQKILNFVAELYNILNHDAEAYLYN